MRPRIAIVALVLTTLGFAIASIPRQAEAIEGGSPLSTHLPFLALISYPSQPSAECGGVVLSDRWVLTAAHCVTTTPVSGIQVSFGSPDKRSQTVTRNPSRVVIHPDFDNREVSDTYDVALIELASPVDLGDPGIGSISLYLQGPRPGELTVAGWGDGSGPHVAASTELNETDCGNDAFQGAYICAGGDGRAPCTGDSGGPLYAGSPGREVLVGIIESTKSPCGSERAVFQRVAPHVCWIITTVGASSIDLFPSSTTLSATGTGGDDLLCGNSQGDILIGGAGDDVIVGGRGPDEINAGQGNDTVYGGLGDDKIRGSGGDDFISGSRGHDTVHGDTGADSIHGGPGADRLYGYADDDLIVGGPGDDNLRGNYGNDLLSGGDGDDVIYGNGDDDIVHGGKGNDLIGGNFGNDVLFGNQGNDIIVGSDGDDLLDGGNGMDALEGNSGQDTLRGGQHDDSLDGGIGVDTCNGGQGADTATRCESVT